MKKVTLLTLFITLSICMMAQSVALLNSKNLWATKSITSGMPVGQDAEYLYYYQYSHPTVGFKAKNAADHLFCIDKNSMSMQEVAITLNEGYGILGGIPSGNGVLLLHQKLSKKGDQISFSVTNVDKTDKAITLSGERSVTTTANPKYWPYFKTATSPNGKLMAAVALVTGKDSRLENLFAVVVNDEGEFVWSGSLTPDFDGKTFSMGNLAMDNNGVLYIPAYTCQLKGNNISDIQFMMIKATENGTDSYTTEVPFGTPQNFTAKVTSDNNVTVAGYFTESKTNTSTKSSGYFFYKVDTSSENFSDLKSFDFSSNYVEKAAWTRFATVLGNQQYSITADDIYELENGSLVLCGEHRFVKAIYDPNMKSWSYHLLTKNILVSTLLADGSSHFTMVEKQQLAGSSIEPYSFTWYNDAISYTAFAHHNDMYFLFTDDPKNVPYPGKDVVCTVSGFKFKSDKWANVLMRLTPDQKITQRVVTDPNQLLRTVEFNDDENYFTIGISNNELILTKHSIEE